MKKMVVVLMMLLAMPSFAETCRAVTKESKAGALSASFGCARGEKPKDAMSCAGDMYDSFTQTWVGTSYFTCVNKGREEVLAYIEEEGPYCDAFNPDDMSCIEPIKVSYQCCKP